MAFKKRLIGIPWRARGPSGARPPCIPSRALQSEYSLWERKLEPEIIPLLRELGFGLVPFAPLGRGFLTGAVTRAEEYPEKDFRWGDPRYSGRHFDANARYLEENIGAARVSPTAGEMAALDAALAPESVSGPRYAEKYMAQIDR